MNMGVRRAAKWLGVLLAALYLVAGTVLYVQQREFIYPGRYAAVSPEVPNVDGMETFRVPTSVGEVDAWYLPPLSGSTPFPALVFGHGNGEVIDQWIAGLDEFRRWGLAVMLAEYPGYGRSAGSPSEVAIREAMVGAYDRLVLQPGVDRQRIIGYGHSLGGGAVCALAAQRPLAALVLQSTFTSIRTFARQFFMPAVLIRDPFDNLQVVRSFEGPTLILHGRDDGLIPVWQAEELARVARKAEIRVYDCGHYCWYPDQLPLYADISGFLRANGVLPHDEEQAASVQP